MLALYSVPVLVFFVGVLVGIITCGIVVFRVVRWAKGLRDSLSQLPRRFNAVRSSRHEKVLGVRSRDPTKKFALLKEMFRDMWPSEIAIEWSGVTAVSGRARVAIHSRGVADFHMDCQYDIYVTDAHTQTFEPIKLIGIPVLQLVKDWAHAYEVGAMENWEFGRHPKKWRAACDPVTEEHVDFLRDCINMLSY